MLLIFAMIGVAATIAPVAGAAERVQFSWPTPNKSWEAGKSPREFLQDAGSGDPASGGFGGVRTGGRQFHEGIDIRPVARDRRGEPTDSVFAAMDGVVRYVNTVAGNSNYGRYVVLEHPDESPAVYTLYAHLARVGPGIAAGKRVTRGDVLGVMGHSSNGNIPRDRAHLHFEIGLMITRDFASWYRAKKFGSPNEHGWWNGMNLRGLDPLDFLADWRSKRVNTFDDYFARMTPAVKVRIATRRTPDFILRYPSLQAKPVVGAPAGWEVWFDWTGLPFRWTPLNSLEVVGLPANEAKIIGVDEAIERRERSRTLAVPRRGRWMPGKDLEPVLDQLFR